MKKKQTKPKCPYCWDKGFYSQATGGNVAMGDFVGDKSYKVPLEIVKIPCPKCKVNSSKQADDGIKLPDGSKVDFIDTITKAYQQGRKDALRQVANEVATSFWIDNKSAQKLLKKINQIKDEKPQRLPLQ